MTEFSDLGLSPTTLKAVADTGYTTATPIQASAIPVALAGRDVLGIAQTGTGKTAAFTLPMVDRLHNGRAKARMPRALVLAPTRELADQVAASFEKYAKGTRLSWALLIGGVSMGDQVSALDKGVDVLIATPGRLIDLFERGKLLMTGVQILVVDEADRMLDMGFIPDIERIFKMTPPSKQTLFFSATMPPEITRLTQQFLKDPTRIEATRPATTNADIKQYIVPLPSSDPKHKRTALRALVGREDVKNGIVFCNRKSEVDVVAKSLKVHGFDAAPIHGDLDQSTRMKTLDAFRKGELAFLCASDVAARGLDIPDVSHVFNYDVPHHADDYVHRIGRTGRAGKKGQTFMLTTPADTKSLDKVISLIKVQPEVLNLDIDWSSVPKDDPARKRERDQARGRGRDKDGRGRGRPASETSTVTMSAITSDEVEKAKESRPEPREAAAEPPQRSESREIGRNEGRRDRGPRPRPEHAAEAREPTPARHTEPRADQERRPRREEAPERRDNARDQGRDHGDDRKVVGFGSDLPAFMRRS